MADRDPLPAFFHTRPQIAVFRGPTHPILNCCPQPVQARGFRRIKPLVISGKLSEIGRLGVKILGQARGFDIELERS
jgi:hypothetical protein